MESKPNLVVFYGSQTGNAQDVAERIGREAAHQKLDATVISMDTYDPGKLYMESIVVFVVATTGQGDPTDNAKDFWKFLLRRNLQSDWLNHLLYAVFGLGDSGYVQYNVMAKKLDKRLSDLGGKPVIKRGLGDDQHPSGYEAELDPWLVNFWKALGNILSLPLGPTFYDSSKLDDPKYQITYSGRQSPNSAGIYRGNKDQVEAMSMLDIADGILEVKEFSGSLSFGPRNPHLARMICNMKLTTNPDERDVRHIELDLGESGLYYNPGDVLAVMPSQRVEDVDAFLSRCNLDPDLLISIQAVKPRNDLKMAVSSKPVTIRSIVQYVMDIASASPRRYFFEVMSHYATAEHEKEKLEYFGTPEGRDDLYEYNQRERRTVLEVLQDFPSVNLPLVWLLQVVPRLKPRLFSISSSLLLHPNQVHITVAVQKWKTPLKRLRSGLCSTWLSHLDPQEGEIFVPVWIKQGNIRLPHPTVPLLLVGPGTGCAPFRAFIEERVAMMKSSEPVISPIMFFFGCRHKEQDFLYKEFWISQTEECGLLSRGLGGGLFVAFSRDQPQKVYVQHKIREHSEDVWRMLQLGCSVYIAGSAHEMPVDVGEALEGVIAKEGHLSKDDAKKWLKQLERSGRYHVEAWQ